MWIQRVIKYGNLSTSFNITSWNQLILEEVLSANTEPCMQRKPIYLNTLNDLWQWLACNAQASPLALLKLKQCTHANTSASFIQCGSREGSCLFIINATKLAWLQPQVTVNRQHANMQWAHHSAIPTAKAEQDTAAVPAICWPQHGPDACLTLPLLWQPRGSNPVLPFPLDTPRWGTKGGEKRRRRWKRLDLGHQGKESSDKKEGKKEGGRRKNLLLLRSQKGGGRN